MAQRTVCRAPCCTRAVRKALLAALSAWMFFLTLNRRGRARHASDQGSLRSAVNALGHVNMTVVLGIIVFLLSDILRMLVENELGR